MQAFFLWLENRNVRNSLSVQLSKLYRELMHLHQDYYNSLLTQELSKYLTELENLITPIASLSRYRVAEAADHPKFELLARLNSLLKVVKRVIHDKFFEDESWVIKVENAIQKIRDRIELLTEPSWQKAKEEIKQTQAPSREKTIGPFGAFGPFGGV